MRNIRCHLTQSAFGDSVKYMSGFNLPNFVLGTVYLQSESKLALAYKEEGEYQSITYRELKDCIENFAKSLLDSGGQKGDKVAILSNNKPEWIIADLGIMASGGVTVPIHTNFSDEYTHHVLSHTEVQTVIIEKSFLDSILKLKPSLAILKRIIVFDASGIRDIIDNGQPLKNNFSALESAHGVKIDYFSELLLDGRDLSHDINKIHLDLDDDASVVYTSGTTGLPKGVVLSHRNFISNIQNVLKYVPVFRNDVFLSFLPLSHVFERTTGCFGALHSGAAIYFAQSAKTIQEDLLEVRPTILVSVPRIYERFYEKIHQQIQGASFLRKMIFHWGMRHLKKAHKMSEEYIFTYGPSYKEQLAKKFVLEKLQARLGGRLRLAISGGAKLNKRIGRFFKSTGINILEGYGTTETSPIIACNLISDNSLGSVGKLLPSVEVKIANDSEILVKGDNVMKGYYRDPEKTKTAFTPDGWLKTGDLGSIDKYGFLSITGRKKEIIITSTGKNIAPHVIEEAMVLSSPYIEQAMIVGEGRKFIGALIVPNIEKLKAIEEFVAEFKNAEELREHNGIMKLFEEEIEKALKKFAEHERVKKFVIVGEPFTVENNLLTPTMKLKRPYIEKRYEEEITSLYL